LKDKFLSSKFFVLYSSKGKFEMKNKFSIAMSLAIIVAMLFTSMVLADEVVDNLDAIIDSAPETVSIITGGSTTVGFYLNATTGGGDVASCNVDVSNPATVTFNVADVTANPSSIQFTSCGIAGKKDVVFSSNIPGTYLVKPEAPTGGKDGSKWDRETAKFNLVVLPVVNFGTSGLPSGVNLTVNWSKTNPAGTAVSGSTSFTSPGPSAGESTKLATTFTYSGFPASLTADGQSCNLTGISPASGFTTNTSTTVTATYNCVSANTPPSVSVTGVSDGASYEIGSVPAAGCSVTDAEDGNSTPAATLSAISGPLASYGLGSQIATCSYTDDGGLTDSASATYSIVDTGAPSISASAKKADNTPYTAGTWTNQDVIVHFDCNDAGSGVASCPADVTYDTEGTFTATGTVSDYAGNTASTNFGPVQIDKTAPTFSCAAAPSGWSATDVSRDCTASDSGGSGLATSASFSLSTNVPADTEDANALTDTAAVTDNAGNGVTAGPLAGNKVDKRAPQLASCDSPDSAWHANDVTLYCQYTDGGSGAGDLTVDLTTAVAANIETSNATASVANSPDADQACDGVGNCAASPADISGNKIDKKAPSITITTPPNGASYLLNQPVTPSFICVDGGSGVTSANCVGPTSVDTTYTGGHTFTVNATDNVGNLSSVSTNYTVAFKICALYDQTKSHKAGSTVPVKLQLCDFNGVNYSSAGIEVKAISVKKLDNSASGILDDSGAANSPDMNFRYDPTLGGTGGYIFNLSTKGLTTGTWRVIFTVNGFPNPVDLLNPLYFVKFDVK
jgi:hypothetical protein